MRIRRFNQKGVAVILFLFALVFAGHYVYSHYVHKSPVFPTQASCGTIEGDSENGSQFFLKDSDYDHLLNCFVKPYQLHHKTSLIFSMTGVDQNISYAFAYSNGKLEELLNSQGELDAGISKGACTQISLLNNFGILFKCNLDGDILFSTDEMPAIPNNF